MSRFIEVQGVYHDANGEKPSSVLLVNLDNVIYLRASDREIWFADGSTREVDYESWQRLLKATTPTTLTTNRSTSDE